jgi:hypothetical protein
MGNANANTVTSKGKEVEEVPSPVMGGRPHRVACIPLTAHGHSSPRQHKSGRRSAYVPARGRVGASLAIPPALEGEGLARRMPAAAASAERLVVERHGRSSPADMVTDAARDGWRDARSEGDWRKPAAGEAANRANTMTRLETSIFGPRPWEKGLASG